MPWDERTRMDQRVCFIGALTSCAYTMTELCRAFGISRKTGYKWLARAAAGAAWKIFGALTRKWLLEPLPPASFR